LNSLKPSRKNILIEQLVLIDGQAACGKGALAPLIASMERVELLNFSPQIENICGLRYLEKIDNDSLETMIKLEIDLVLYETMMGRNTNFRFSDQSSAFNDVNFFEYIKRLFRQGDKIIPKKIKEEKPILYFMTHAMLGLSNHLFDCLGEKLNIIELVRHPKSMLSQQTSYNEWWLTDEGKKRQFQLFFNYEGEEVPFWTKGWERLYLDCNPVERAIYEMDHHIKVTEKFKNLNKSTYNYQCISIPFENYVVEPVPYLELIANILKTRIGKKTERILRKENLPRKKEIINNKKISEFLYQKNACKDSIDLLENLSTKYEQMYLK